MYVNSFCTFGISGKRIGILGLSNELLHSVIFKGGSSYCIAMAFSEVKMGYLQHRFFGAISTMKVIAVHSHFPKEFHIVSAKYLHIRQLRWMNPELDEIIISF